MSHASKCVLRHVCTLADTPPCNDMCSSFIAMHGLTGNGGRVGNAGVPADYRLVTLAKSPARTEQAYAYAMVDAYAATFKRQFDVNGQRVKSLYLYSESPGTGKTTTAAALLNEWLTVHYIGGIQRGRQALERPGYFVDLNSMQTLFNRIHLSVGDDKRKAVSDEFQRQLDLASNTPFVVIDDVGVRTATEAFRAYVHDVINHRVTNGMPTCYTSNVRMRDLATVFDARLADRIRDQCVEINFAGTSKRGIRN
ncbi:DNA replication protein [Paenibacillus naphthalenovorans]|uniref:DNA replication protein n=1 Tax=Paenibacillus naphthalenovorans TaxID=162209 RepID=UPI003D297C32